MSTSPDTNPLAEIDDLSPEGGEHAAAADPLNTADVDAAMLDQMVRHGAVLTNQRPIRHYLYAKNRNVTAAAVQELRTLGYKVKSHPSAAGNYWLLLAERTEVVDAASLAASRQLFERLAAAMDGGDYDGCEATMLKEERR